jgi:signal transduction histidine kinase
MNTETNVTGDRLQLPQEHQVTLYRAAQEALTNARRHSGAESVVLTLSYMEDLVLMDVQDDGAGFDPDSVNGDGYGLKAMRERVRELGGETVVESAPGEGTTLAVRVPADSREEA